MWSKKNKQLVEYHMHAADAISLSPSITILVCSGTETPLNFGLAFLTCEDCLKD